jgi:hypothetical protein
MACSLLLLALGLGRLGLLLLVALNLFLATLRLHGVLAGRAASTASTRLAHGAGSTNGAVAGGAGSGGGGGVLGAVGRVRDLDANRALSNGARWVGLKRLLAVNLVGKVDVAESLLALLGGVIRELDTDNLQSILMLRYTHYSPCQRQC